MYPPDFINLVTRCRQIFNDDDFIIGGGNPNAQLLFVGQEPSNHAEDSNTLSHYEKLIVQGGEDNYIRDRKREREYFVSKGQKEPSYWRYPGSLWYRYQQLYDLIVYGKKRQHNQYMDFESEVFCSEMNGTPSKKHINADTQKLPVRKDSFFTDPYFERFKVIILACGHCIYNEPGRWEINKTFKVHLDLSKPIPEQKASIRNNFWAHVDDCHNRIVIHTTNLSGRIKDQLIYSIADTVRTFLREHYPDMLKQ